MRQHIVEFIQRVCEVREQFLIAAVLLDGAEPERSEVLFHVNVRDRLHERAEDYFGVVLEVDLQNKKTVKKNNLC